MELRRRGDNGGEAVELGRRALKAAKMMLKVEDRTWLCPYYYGH